MLSKPTTDRSRGTEIPASSQASISPIAPWSFQTKTAVGALGPAERVSQRHRPAADADRPRAGLPPQRRHRLDAGVAQLGRVAGVAGAVAAGLDRGGADVADAGVAEVEQVPRGKASALAVARPDGVAPLLAQPDRDDRDVGLAERCRQLRRPLDQREEHEPGHPLLEQGVDPCGRELLVALDVAEHRRVAAAEERPLDDLREVGVVRVSEVADEHADHRRPALHELAGDAVRLVVQPLDDGEHALARLVRHLVHSADDVRDGRFRNAGLVCDVEDRDAPSHADSLRVHPW